MLTLERVILPRDERVAHANVGVVVRVQVPLAEGGVTVPFPFCFPFPLSCSLFHRLQQKRENSPVILCKTMSKPPLSHWHYALMVKKAHPSSSL